MSEYVYYSLKNYIKMAMRESLIYMVLLSLDEN